MALKNKTIFFSFFLLSYCLHAQVNRYVVFFRDKTGTPYSISEPGQFLSQKAIDRRTKQSILITEEDLPVNPAYIAQVRERGAAAYFSSHWMNAVLVETDQATIDQIKLLPSVDHTEYVAPGKKLSGRIRKVRSRKENSIAPATKTQLQMLGIDQMHNDGFMGQGITIAVFDAGFLGVNTALPFQQIIQENRLLDSFDFVSRSGNVFAFDDHGTEVLSVIGAYSEGNYTGGAYKANFQLYVTEDADSEYRIEEYNWLFAAERADSAGVDIINSSLGYNLFDDTSMDYSKADLDGKTAIISKAAGKAIARGIVVVCSAGNEGNNSWQLVTPPADVNGILATGSVNSSNSKSTFSSIGPTADNRIKPDVVALGSGTSVIKPSGVLTTQSGTSVASPLIASLAAGILQAYPHLTGDELYQTIIKSADQFSQPTNFKGYGLPSYALTTGYLESTTRDEIILYPNPITGSSLQISIKSPSAEPTQIQVFAVDGKLISEIEQVITTSNNPFECDFSALQSGTYLIKVKSGVHFRTTRLVKP